MIFLRSLDSGESTENVSQKFLCGRETAVGSGLCADDEIEKVFKD